MQVVNAPIVNVFIAKISHAMAKKDYTQVWPLIQEVLIKTVSMFFSTSIILYFSLPYILNIFFNDKFTSTDINTIQTVFIYLIVYFSILTIESPFGSVLSLLKMYNFGLLVNVIFFFLMSIGYIIFQSFILEYKYFLLFLIVSQLSNAILYISKYRLEMRREGID